MRKNSLKIAITGVESTGKSTLARELSAYFETEFLPEIAREYLENKGQNYEYKEIDVINIGNLQAEKQNAFFGKINGKIKTQSTKENIVSEKKPYFCDTELSVIKIWYETKYQKSLPSQLENLYLAQDFDLYLLPYPDLVWEYDPMRESADLETRLALFQKYKNELETQKRPYFIVKGINEQRLQNSILAIKNLLV